MKKAMLLLPVILFFSQVLTAQVCKCDEVKFSISKWVCQGKDANGNPKYGGSLTVTNNSKCKFTLTEIMQQVAGDVTMTLPVSVAPGSTTSFLFVYTDHPPFAPAGNTPFFIVVYTLDKGKCKFEFASDKIPACKTDCQCNPAASGWQGFVSVIHNKTQKVTCGYQFTLTCADTITLKGAYKCLGDCAAKYTAVLKNTTTNTVVQNYPSFTFPWSFTFPGPGNYSLEITPICGDKKCNPCRFFFTVKDCKPVCDCNPEGWQPFEATVNKVVQKIKCGFQFSLKPGSVVQLTGKYVCKGNCAVKYVAVLKNVTTNTVVHNYNP